MLEDGSPDNCKVGRKSQFRILSRAHLDACEDGSISMVAGSTRQCLTGLQHRKHSMHEDHNKPFSFPRAARHADVSMRLIYDIGRSDLSPLASSSLISLTAFSFCNALIWHVSRAVFNPVSANAVTVLAGIRTCLTKTHSNYLDAISFSSYFRFPSCGFPLMPSNFRPPPLDSGNAGNFKPRDPSLNFIFNSCCCLSVTFEKLPFLVKHFRSKQRPVDFLPSARYLRRLRWCSADKIDRLVSPGAIVRAEKTLSGPSLAVRPCLSLSVRPCTDRVLELIDAALNFR